MATSLSAGAVIRDMLVEAGILKSGKANKIYPIVVDKAELPYVVYRRAALTQNPAKAGYPGADTVDVEVLCYAATYGESVELAEQVRQALDCKQGGRGGLVMRGCYLSASDETYSDDAFCQSLTFTIKI